MDYKISKWIEKFQNGDFSGYDFKTQCDAGWYDWFCKTESLRNKTYRMGRIISKIQPGGKVDMESWYVWFKNNCPMSGPLYDDFRFADLETGDVQMTIQIDCCWNDGFKYCVYGRTPQNPQGQWDKPIFKCGDSRELVKWFNSPWED